MRATIVIALLAGALGVGCSSQATTVSTAPPTTVAASVAPGAPTGARAGTTATGTMSTGSLTTADGRTRTYRVYVPSGLSATTVPLLVALHGGTGWGAQFEGTSGFDRLAQSNGFIVVYPDGVGTGADETKLRTWNGGGCCGAAQRLQVDDVGFVRAVIDRMEAQYSIDPARVFAAGHSNGGILDYRLACELSDRIVAVGLQSGTMEIPTCAPGTPVSLLHIHGTADDNIPIDGGRGGSSIANVAFASPRDSVAKLAAADGCGSAVTGVDAPYTVTSWTGCPTGTDVMFVAVQDAPHKWMADSSYMIVSFLLQHPRPVG